MPSTKAAAERSPAASLARTRKRARRGGNSVSCPRNSGCVIEIDGPPDTITIRINAAEDLEEELGIVMKDRRH